MASCISKAMGTLRTGVNLVIYTTKLKTCHGLFIQRSVRRNFGIKCGSLDPPNVSRLAETARIALTPQEVEEFGPKIQKVVDWFGQLQAVDLESIEPAIRSDIDDDNLREDRPEPFENREAIIASIPSYEAPYIKVPKVLNKE